MTSARSLLPPGATRVRGPEANAVGAFGVSRGVPAASPGSRRSPIEQIELRIDKDGSLVTLEAGSWFVCFVPGLDTQWWHRFVNERHKHVFAMRPAGPDQWTLFEPWWHRLLTATITDLQAKKFLLWGARGDVLLVREAIPGSGTGQFRGWMNCAGLTSYLLGRPYWVWTPEGLYQRLLREPNVCRVDVSALLRMHPAELSRGSRIITACAECAPGARSRRRGSRKPFCMCCGRDLAGPQGESTIAAAGRGHVPLAWGNAGERSREILRTT